MFEMSGQHTQNVDVKIFSTLDCYTPAELHASQSKRKHLVRRTTRIQQLEVYTIGYHMAIDRFGKNQKSITCFSRFSSSDKINKKKLSPSPAIVAQIIVTRELHLACHSRDVMIAFDLLSLLSDSFPKEKSALIYLCMFHSPHFRSRHNNFYHHLIISKNV